MPCFLQHAFTQSCFFLSSFASKAHSQSNPAYFDCENESWEVFTRMPLVTKDNGSFLLSRVSVPRRPSELLRKQREGGGT